MQIFPYKVSILRRCKYLLLWALLILLLHKSLENSGEVNFIRIRSLSSSFKILKYIKILIFLTNLLAIFNEMILLCYNKPL